jgi:hypothetical protein
MASAQLSRKSVWNLPAHVPAKWMPVRRQEHAPNKGKIERIPLPQERNTL